MGSGKSLTADVIARRSTNYTNKREKLSFVMLRGSFLFDIAVTPNGILPTALPTAHRPLTSENLLQSAKLHASTFQSERTLTCVYLNRSHSFLH